MLNHPTKAVGRELLEDVPDFPFAGGNPLPVRCLIHGPQRLIQRLLASRPKAKGLAAPGMPLGSPGMEGPRKDAYDVLMVLPDGSSRVYQHYN